MKIGYLRVSTNDQNLENQISLLKENGCEEIFSSKISSELENLLSQIRKDDTFVVCQLDRLALLITC